MLKELHTLLAFDRPTEIVDVGANPVDGAPPYKLLLKHGLCRVTGFEPQDDARAALERNKSVYESYLPYVVGDGADVVLNICRHSGWTSVLAPSEDSLRVFTSFRQNAQVLRQVAATTMTLDSIPEIQAIDFLKIDIQGGELAAFRGAARHLARTAVVQTEVSFVNLYDGQPSFGEIDAELRKHGFIPHCLADTRKGIIAPFMVNKNPWEPLNQLQEADLVYVKDFRHPERLSDAQLKHICLVSHACYGSFDLAYWCILALQERGALAPGATERYMALLNSAFQTPTPAT